MLLLDLPNELLQIAQGFTHSDLAHFLLANRLTAYLFQQLLERLALDPKNNITALHWACSCGYLPLAKLLRDFGLDLNEKCQTLGRMPLHFAVTDPNLRNNVGRTPLHWSTLCESYGMSARLPEHGAGVRIKNSAWMTLLHCALEGAVEALTQLVTEQGIETPADADTATIPVPKEEYLRRRKVVKLILDNRPWLDAQDKASLTALHYPAKSRRKSVAKWLLERGADAYVGDGNGCTALEVTKFVGHVKVAGVLREHYEKERELLCSVFVGNVLEIIGIGGQVVGRVWI